MSTYEISKSSLLSLKAEILRKQEELNKAKLQNKAKLLQPKKPTPLEIKNKGIEQREINDLNEEDEDLLRKSRAALESKSRLYEKLSKRSNFTDDEIEHNRRFLVRFDKKKKNYSKDLPPSDDESFDKYPESEEEQHLSDEYEPAKNPDEDWVEYTDCLGRTRKCMRKDLEFLKSKDAELRASVDKDENKAEQLSKPTNRSDRSSEDDSDTAQNEYNEKSELLSSDMRRELLRQQWEKEEDELRKKDDIHYQDILFNEARTHGVGYYGFSKDEGERARQQEALKNLRQNTEQLQKKAQELRNLREKQLAARAKAARNRKRARMGLPPEEDEPEVTPQPQEVVINEEEVKEKAEEVKKEKQKEDARKKHIRPWDIGKEGVKEHYEYTQEEWVDKKRKERPQEFAPPTAYNKRSFRSAPDVIDSETETKKTLYFSTKKHSSKETSKSSTQKHVSSKEEEISSTSKTNINPYKSTEDTPTSGTSSAPFKSVPIVNECEDFDDVQDRLIKDFELYQKNNKNKDDSLNDNERGKGVEIAPPPTFDYYGPSGVKKRKTHKKENLEESITAGLKFLRQQAEKKDTSIKYPSEMFLS